MSKLDSVQLRLIQMDLDLVKIYTDWDRFRWIQTNSDWFSLIEIDFYELKVHEPFWWVEYLHTNYSVNEEYEFDKDGDPGQGLERLEEGPEKGPDTFSLVRRMVNTGRRRRSLTLERSLTSLMTLKSRKKETEIMSLSGWGEEDVRRRWERWWKERGEYKLWMGVWVGWCLWIYCGKTFTLTLSCM